MVVSTRRLVVDGRTAETDEIGIQAIGITPTLFDTLGLPIVSGRTFTEQETESAGAGVAILNQALANRLWPGDSAVDRRIGFRDGQDINWLRVVGVVPDIHYEEIGEGTDASRLNVYVPYGSDGSRSMALLVRAEGAPEALVSPMREPAAIAGQHFSGVSPDADERAAAIHHVGTGVLRQLDGRLCRRWRCYWRASASTR